MPTLTTFSFQQAGKTSNAHALRMVGTLQSETSQAHERANELTVALRIAQGEVEALSGKVKLGDNERRNMEERMSQLRQELRKLSVQLAAKTEECARVRVEYEKARVELAQGGGSATTDDIADQTQKGGSADELSTVMLERDNLSRSNEEMIHQNEQVSYHMQRTTNSWLNSLYYSKQVSQLTSIVALIIVHSPLLIDKLQSLSLNANWIHSSKSAMATRARSILPTRPEKTCFLKFGL